MYYLSIIYYLCIKILQILWKIFLIPSLYILQKKFFLNEYKKQMCYKENTRLVEACPSNFWRSEKKKKRQRKKRKGFEASTIKSLSLRSKCYYFSHSRASRIQKFSLFITILFSVLWLLHFEIHLAGPEINFYILMSLKIAKFFLQMFTIFSMIRDSFLKKKPARSTSAKIY